MMINVNISLAIVHNTIVGAFEGGSNHWLHTAKLIEGYRKLDDNLVWWGHIEVLEQPFKFEVTFDDPNEDEGSATGKRTITNVDLTRALTLMAAKSPRHFSDLVSEGDDAITHDVFMQYLILDDVVYG